jgi:hypothetical protein
MSRKAIVILIAIFVLIIVASAVGVALLIGGARTPQVHLLPDGYKGWAHAKYGVEGAPLLPVEDGKLVFRYGEDGKLETSTEYEEGWSVSNYYYVDGDVRKPLRQMPPGFEGEIWGAGTSTSMVITRSQGEVTRIGASSHFFVGSYEQYRAAQQGLTFLPEP